LSFFSFYRVHKGLPPVPVLSHSSYILPYLCKSNLRASSQLRQTSSLLPGLSTGASWAVIFFVIRVTCPAIPTFLC
jgi:hypothetical protein